MEKLLEVLPAVDDDVRCSLAVPREVVGQTRIRD
jgi:hypothetical protein